MGVFNDRVLFIHIPKTGGTSAKHWLWKVLPDARGQKPGDNSAYESAGLPIGHVPLRDIERFTGRPPSSFEKIVAILRNPYSQQLSQWMFWRDRYARGGRHIHDIGAARHPDLPSWLEDPVCDFHLWYENRFHPTEKPRPMREAPANGYAGFGGYYRFWLAVDGEIPPNVEVVRQEELGEAFPRLMAPYVRADMPFPHVNRSVANGLDPLPYYNHRAMDLVEAKFRWAFDNHYPRWDR